jgi:TusA-related sulfurtransferase
MPLLMMKRKLGELIVGQILEVKGDCVPAFDNISRWVKNNGHELVCAECSDGRFLIKIKKQ